MSTRRLITTAVAVGCLTLAACGSDGEGPDVTLPTSVTVPERSTTVPTDPATTETPSTETSTTPTTVTRTTRTTETRTTETPATESPATETPTTEALASAPQEGADDAAPWWPWLLLGAALLGLIAFLATRRSRREAAWRRDVGAALDETTRLATHLAAVAPEGVAMVAAQDAGQLAALAATLSDLSAATSDEASRRAITSVRDQVQALHGVVDGITMGSGAPSPAALEYLREQATTLHGVSARARAEVLPATTGTGAPAT